MGGLPVPNAEVPCEGGLPNPNAKPGVGALVSCAWVVGGLLKAKNGGGAEADSSRAGVFEGGVPGGVEISAF